jgi:YjbE family integral membrane protein
VIALAARSLPPAQQKKAVIWGSGAAVVMRIVLTIVAVELLRLPYLKFIGAALLLWIGIQLLVPEEEAQEGGGASDKAGMIAAIRTILIADLVMSLDNVIAVAAAAKGSVVLLALGLLISIPLVIFGSTVLMRFMERWPAIVTIGAALIGWVAGEMAATDPSIKEWVDANAAWLHWGAPIIGAVLVVVIGKWLEKRSAETEDDRPIVDLPQASDQHAGAAAGARMRVLLAADDSEESLRGVRNFIAQAHGTPVSVDLLSVQAPLHRDVSTFVEEAAIKSLHHDEGLKALAPVRAALEEAGIANVVHIGVGDFPHVVVHYAKSLGAQKVYLTQTARNDGIDLPTTIDHMKQHFDLPVAVLE